MGMGLGRRREARGGSPAPALSALDSNAGWDWEERTLTATGTNLDTATSVTVDGEEVDFEATGATEIEFELPTHVVPMTGNTDVVDVVVTGPGGSATLTYTYRWSFHSFEPTQHYRMTTGLTTAAGKTSDAANLGSAGATLNLSSEDAGTGPLFDAASADFNGKPALELNAKMSTGAISLADPSVDLWVIKPTGSGFRDLTDGQVFTKRLIEFGGLTVYVFSDGDTISGAVPGTAQLLVTVRDDASSGVYSNDLTTPVVAGTLTSQTITKFYFGGSPNAVFDGKVAEQCRIPLAKWDANGKARTAFYMDLCYDIAASA